MSCVVTLALDDEAQCRFQSLRQRYFPPERNLIPAHLTLFHTLPESDATVSVLAGVAAQQSCFELLPQRPRSIGRGVAFFFASPNADALHRKLSDAFYEHLTAQDRQGFRPHIVLQNKVTAEIAHATLQSLEADFNSFPIQAVGLDLWRYLDGPWQHLQRFAFCS